MQSAESARDEYERSADPHLDEGFTRLQRRPQAGSPLKGLLLRSISVNEKEDSIR
jgi:hypothetical protein